eukprot:213161_1
MYDEIIEIAENRLYLNAVNNENINVNYLDEEKIPEFEEEMLSMEERLKESNELEFDKVFHNPVGDYLIQCFMTGDYSVAKARFIQDVDLFKKIRDVGTRAKIAKKIYMQYMTEHDEEPQAHQDSVFKHRQMQSRAVSMAKETCRSRTPSTLRPEESQTMSLQMGGDTNPIGVYGKKVKLVKERISKKDVSVDIFNDIEKDVLVDLRMDVFPRFRKSYFYKEYIHSKILDSKHVGFENFKQLRVIGRGAFGLVSACLKEDSGQVYAVKALNKKRVMASDSVDAVMAERDYATLMDSRFVAGLHYAYQDKDNLYLVFNLLSGGDLKYHLIRDDLFDEKRSKFYAAQILLGLQHIHEKKIIYRDLKLENVLLDEAGNCALLDLGLAVRKERTKGYAGTPGYTAPEIVLNATYDKTVDFFSYGVLIYRFLCGKKPFGRQPGDLDKNVVEIEPEYQREFFSDDAVSLLRGLLVKNPEKRLGSGANGIEDIKNHKFFDDIDFGLLEAGYIDPPFTPKSNEVNADAHHGERNKHDDKYRKHKLTEDFEKSLNAFDYVSRKAIQMEIKACMEKRDKDVDFRRVSARKPEVEKPKVVEKTKHHGCCVIC